MDRRVSMHLRTSSASLRLGGHCPGRKLRAAVPKHLSEHRRVTRFTKNARCTVALGELSADQYSPPRKVAVFVEPSPFSHVSGMKIRFQSLITELRKAGDEVLVVTPDHNPPKEFKGAKVVKVLGVPLPFYNSKTLLLSLGLSPFVWHHLRTMAPDIIHVSSPGLLVFSAILYARLLKIPLVVSYHTHIPEYIPRYTWRGLVEPMWKVIRFFTRMADLTLVPSAAMKVELAQHRIYNKRIDVWQRAVDTDLFHPRYRSNTMRGRITQGHPERVVLTYVGRLGAEKNLAVLREILEALPTAHLSFVGDGPHRAELEQHFVGTNTTFMGMLSGEDLWSAYASADVFVMPSETETLGFVAMEAMSSGVPVVSVAAGGLVDIMASQHGVTGFLYQPGDYAGALEATRKLVEDGELRRRMGDAARTEAERWGWTPAIQRVRSLQYGRAIRIASATRRFKWMAVRSNARRVLHAVTRSTWRLLAAVWRLLTYPLRLLTAALSRPRTQPASS